MTKKIHHSKHYARYAAVQALYQWHHTQHQPEEIIQQFIDDQLLEHADRKYFKKLVSGIIAEQENLDSLFVPLLDREVTTLNPVELAIIRLGAYELVHCLEIPYKVVINEALEITKNLGAQEGYKYVNAVLDGLAKQLRQVEYR